jgi:hypothetical protein
VIARLMAMHFRPYGLGEPFRLKNDLSRFLAMFCSSMLILL